MTDKVTIQPKSKPEKTTISISGETSERLEIYCRANGIFGDILPGKRHITERVRFSRPGIL